MYSYAYLNMHIYIIIFLNNTYIQSKLKSGDDKYGIINYSEALHNLQELFYIFSS